MMLDPNVDSIVIKENWLTKPPHPRAALLTLLLTAALCAFSLIYLGDVFGAQSWAAASRAAVFQNHEYWRAWTALLIHSGSLHLLSNLFLFAPLTFWLSGYFSMWFFPLSAFAIGGLINLLVLQTMPAHTELLGVSGVVYWMGSTWLTLFLLIDRRHSFKRRFTAAISLVIILLTPETYTPEVSYMSHLLGFIAGIPCAWIFYSLNRAQIEAAEVKEYVYADDENPAAQNFSS